MRRASFMLLAAFLASILGRPAAAGDFDLPKNALALLSEAKDETCSVCARRKVKEAMQLLGAVLRPGVMVSGDRECPFRKTGSGRSREFVLACYPGESLKRAVCNAQSLPEVVFMFHTASDRLVGIPDDALTDDETAGKFMALEEGAPFTGSLELVAYAYGEGPTFTYLSTSARLLVHCRLVQVDLMRQEGAGAEHGTPNRDAAPSRGEEPGVSPSEAVLDDGETRVRDVEGPVDVLLGVRGAEKPVVVGVEEHAPPGALAAEEL